MKNKGCFNLENINATVERHLAVVFRPLKLILFVKAKEYCVHNHIFKSFISLMVYKTSSMGVSFMFYFKQLPLKVEFFLPGKHSFFFILSSFCKKQSFLRKKQIFLFQLDVKRLLLFQLNTKSFYKNSFFSSHERFFFFQVNMKRFFLLTKRKYPRNANSLDSNISKNALQVVFVFFLEQRKHLRKHKLSSKPT